jgi:two-component system cell cycle response regulator
MTSRLDALDHADAHAEAHGDDHGDDHGDEPSYEKTAVVKGDTFHGRIKDAQKSPPCLVMLEGPAGYVGKRWPIDKSEIIIGRSMNSVIFVDDRSVSKSHAKLSRLGDEIFITDLESTNHTIVNDEAIQSLIPVKLNANDQIKTGNVLFKFLEEGSLEAHALEHLQTKSEKDPLTGAFNKGALTIKGNESFKRAKLLKVPLSLAVFDIDHFKKINDTHGHAAGDYVLKELSQVISSKLIRLDDFFARYGGEEFVVLLFGSNLTQGSEIGERLRQTIESHQFVFQGTKIPVTISVGVSTLQSQMATWEEMFTKADGALYQAKRSGRNRVVSSN